MARVQSFRCDNCSAVFEFRKGEAYGDDIRIVLKRIPDGDLFELHDASFQCPACREGRLKDVEKDK